MTELVKENEVSEHQTDQTDSNSSHANCGIIVLDELSQYSLPEDSILENSVVEDHFSVDDQKIHVDANSDKGVSKYPLSESCFSSVQLSSQEEGMDLGKEIIVDQIEDQTVLDGNIGASISQYPLEDMTGIEDYSTVNMKDTIGDSSKSASLANECSISQLIDDKICPEDTFLKQEQLSTLTEQEKKNISRSNDHLTGSELMDKSLPTVLSQITKSTDTLASVGLSEISKIPSFRSEGNLSSAPDIKDSLVDGLGYSTDSIRSHATNQSLYSQDTMMSSTEDVQPLLQRVQKMGVMVLPYLSSHSSAQKDVPSSRDDISHSDNVSTQSREDFLLNTDQLSTYSSSTQHSSSPVGKYYQ